MVVFYFSPTCLSYSWSTGRLSALLSKVKKNLTYLKPTAVQLLPLLSVTFFLFIVHCTVYSSETQDSKFFFSLKSPFLNSVPVHFLEILRLQVVLNQKLNSVQFFVKTLIRYRYRHVSNIFLTIFTKVFVDFPSRGTYIFYRKKFTLPPTFS